MPSIETAFRRQKAILFMKVGVDDYGQALVTDEPVEIDVRWNKKRGMLRDPQGNEVAIDGYAVVAQTIEVGSQMWLGELNDFLGTGSGSAGYETEVMEVVDYKETPDIKNRNLRRTVALRKFRDEPHREDEGV